MTTVSDDQVSPARRRVLVLNHFAAPADAPGGTRHVELFGRLTGWDATVVAARRNLLTGRPVDGGGGLLRGVWTSPYRANGAARLANWITYAVSAGVEALRLERPDVVYASSPHLLAGLTGWLLAKRWRVPLVLEIRDLWPRVLIDMGQLAEDSKVYRALSALERFLYRRAERIVVLAAGTERSLVADGVAPEKLRLIPNGAEPSDFVPSAPVADLRRRFGFTGTVALYAGAHGPANGLDLLIDAAAELRHERPQLRLVLVGGGVDKPRLAERIDAEGLTNVELRDPVPKSAIPELLAAADIGLHVLADVALFRYGVSPNKLFDYLAAGLPVITNTRGEVADLVEASGAGLAVAPDGLADGLRQMVDASAEQRRRWADNGPAYMQRTHSRTILAGRLEALLDEVTA